MGNKSSSQPIAVNNTQTIDVVKSLMKPFDLLLFSSDDYVSEFIKFAQVRELKKPDIISRGEIRISKGDISGGDIFSHVGILVTSDVIDHESIAPGKYYILESTIGGNVVDVINGKFSRGVQLRDFDDVCKAYLTLGDGSNKIAWAPLLRHPLNDVKQKFTEIFNVVHNLPYDWNPVDIGSAISPWCQRHRDLIDRLLRLNGQSWMFCSELVATIYKDFEILPETITPVDVAPMDYIGYGSDGGQLPIVVKLPVTYLKL